MHVPTLLHELIGTGHSVWGPCHTILYLPMKAMIVADAMSCYPDLNKHFNIYIDASEYQMGAAIIQDGHPIAYWSKKMTDLQHNYNTKEKEL